MSRVTALCWAQAFSLWVLDQPSACKNRPAESLLVGRLDGSLCWLQVTMQEIDLHVKSTELTHCHRKECEEMKYFSGNILPVIISYVTHKDLKSNGTISSMFFKMSELFKRTILSSDLS